MIIRPYSDLHLDVHSNPMYSSNPNRTPFKPDLDGVDVLILAGDIAEGVQGVEWASNLETDIPIIYVMGNHEYYRHDVDTLVDEARDVAAENVFILNEDTLLFDNADVKIAFHGATMWSDFAVFGNQQQHIDIVGRALNDFRAIRKGDRVFKPEDALALHESALQYFDFALTEYADCDYHVVVTHHGPSLMSSHPKYLNDAVTAGFVSDLGNFLAYRQPAYWIHGHVHNAGQYKLHETEVVHNPFGYPSERTRLSAGFQHSLALELK